jgi:CBS domain-containing protein
MYASVIAATSSSTVLDAMRLMSDGGVSSVAVVDDGGGGYGAGYGSWGGLTGAVSVTDVGKVCLFSLSPQCRA